MGVGRKYLLLAIAFGLACGVALLLVPRLFAIVTFYLGYGPLKDLFFSRMGLSGAASDLIAGALAFFFPLATFVLFANILAVWTGRAGFGRVARVFLAFAFVYLLPAAAIFLTDRFAAPACFDQSKGEPRLFYTIEPGGVIELSDSKGFDRFGVERKPVTSDICQIADRQRSGTRPKGIPTGNLANIDFFDRAGGGALIFYSRGADGRVDLFDGPGVNPTTNMILAPVTADVVEEVKKAVEIQEQQRVDAEKRSAEQEAQKAAEVARQEALNLKSEKQAADDARLKAQKDQEEAAAKLEAARAQALSDQREADAKLKAATEALKIERQAREKAERDRAVAAAQKLQSASLNAPLEKAPPGTGEPQTLLSRPSGTAQRPCTRAPNDGYGRIIDYEVGCVITFEKDTDRPSGDVYISPDRLVTVRVLTGTAVIMTQDGNRHLLQQNADETIEGITDISPNYPGFVRFSVEYRK